MKNIVKVKKTEKGIEISISTKDLIMIAKTHSDSPLKVVDKELFLKDLVNKLQSWQDVNSQEVGCTALEYTIDECIQEVFMSGSESVEAIEIE